LDTSRVAGTVGNHLLEYDFRIDWARDVEFIAELRATAGEVLFETESLRLLKRD
jgi:hypothetical protein